MSKSKSGLDEKFGKIVVGSDLKVEFRLMPEAVNPHSRASFFFSTSSSSQQQQHRHLQRCIMQVIHSHRKPRCQDRQTPSTARNSLVNIPTSLIIRAQLE